MVPVFPESVYSCNGNVFFHIASKTINRHYSGIRNPFPLAVHLQGEASERRPCLFHPSWRQYPPVVSVRSFRIAELCDAGHVFCCGSYGSERLSGYFIVGIRQLFLRGQRSICRGKRFCPYRFDRSGKDRMKGYEFFF